MSILSDCLTFSLSRIKVLKMSKRVFVTKYALTDGIAEVTLVDDTTYPTMAKVTWDGGPNGTLMINKKDVHDTIDQAYDRIRTLIAAKRKSHEKAIKTLDGLTAQLDQLAFLTKNRG